MWSSLPARIFAHVLRFLPATQDRHGAAVSEFALCSTIAGDVLQHGGSAVDAMIAQVLCVGTAQGNYHSGIGGGGFALVRSIDSDGVKQYETVDFGVQAPGLANETLFEHRSAASLTGGLAAAIPGQLLGLEYLHEKYGKLPWSDLFQPSIQLARDGFEINRDLYRAMRSVAPKSNETHDVIPETLPSFLQLNPLFRSIFAHPNGTLLPIGSRTTRPQYARTLEKIAKGGARVMYEGEMARGLVEAIERNGGIWTEDDLAGYRIRTGTPLCISYRNHTIMSAGAPSGGASLLSTLNALSGYEMNGVGDALDDHRMVEALKHTYSRRNLLGDPEYVSDVHDLEKESLTYESGARDRARIVDDRTFGPDYYDPVGYAPLNDHGTSQLVAADSDGLVISVTTTVTGYWGAQIMDPASGIIFNNGMANFASNATSPFGYIAAPANFIKPHKRALSSMCPYLIEGPDMIYAGGSAGGSRIISANAQVIRNGIDYGMSAPEAILQPRLHDQVVPIGTSLELSRPADNPEHDVHGFSEERAEELSGRGHNVTWIGVGQSVPAGLLWRAGQGWEVGADGRRWDAGGVLV